MWTIYSSDVSFAAAGKVHSLRHLASLTPLPSAREPEIMFDGMTPEGKWAVFQLAAGVQIKGPAWCRPSVTMCTSMMLPKNGVETLTYTSSTGTVTSFDLALTHVGVTRTKSAEAVAAARRVSVAGACELQMADSVKLDPSTLTASAPKPDKVCARQPGLVPFLGIGS